MKLELAKDIDNTYRVDSDLISLSRTEDSPDIDDYSDAATIQFPVRDWVFIITQFELAGNRPFMIPAIYCSKIIERIKSGMIPRKVFEEYGFGYQAFQNRYTKARESVELLMRKGTLDSNEYKMLNALHRDPHFILGNDIDRAKAYNYNYCSDKLRELSEGNAAMWKEYMKMVHAEEFVEKNQTTTPIIFQIGGNILDAI
jgi:hypothetical protein